MTRAIHITRCTVFVEATPTEPGLMFQRFGRRVEGYRFSINGAKNVRALTLLARPEIELANLLAPLSFGGAR